MRGYALNWCYWSLFYCYVACVRTVSSIELSTIMHTSHLLVEYELGDLKGITSGIGTVSYYDLLIYIRLVMLTVLAVIL